MGMNQKRKKSVWVAILLASILLNADLSFACFAPLPGDCAGPLPIVNSLNCSPGDPGRWCTNTGGNGCAYCRCDGQCYVLQCGSPGTGSPGPYCVGGPPPSASCASFGMTKDLTPICPGDVRCSPLSEAGKKCICPAGQFWDVDGCSPVGPPGPSPSPGPSGPPSAGCPPNGGDFPASGSTPAMSNFRCVCSQSGGGIAPDFYYPDLTYQSRPCGTNPAVCDRWFCTATGSSPPYCQPGMNPI